jgi:hypothetical protein
MHGGHDHSHHHHHHGNGSAGAGHNHRTAARNVVQWQTPHKADQEPEGERREPDLDLVEAAFVEGFARTADPTSFLRLAHIPFEALDTEGRKLVMLRVETEAVTDVGSVTPHLGGETLRYDPLPARMVAQRRRLRFVYFDGGRLRLLTLAEASALTAV